MHSCNNKTTILKTCWWHWPLRRRTPPASEPSAASQVDSKHEKCVRMRRVNERRRRDMYLLLLVGGVQPSLHVDPVEPNDIWYWYYNQGHSRWLQEDCLLNGKTCSLCTPVCPWARCSVAGRSHRLAEPVGEDLFEYCWELIELEHHRWFIRATCFLQIFNSVAAACAILSSKPWTTCVRVEINNFIEPPIDSISRDSVCFRSCLFAPGLSRRQPIWDNFWRQRSLSV